MVVAAIVEPAEAMESAPTRCVSCGSSDLRLLGPIPDSDSFAGVRRSNLSGGTLWFCRVCMVGFRYPRLSKAEAADLYSEAPGTAWQNPFGSRKDWVIARDWIELRKDRPLRVLDVGCSTGSFLANAFSVADQRFGLEFNRAASRIAEDRGVRILGTSLDELAAAANRQMFDVITAFDVVEHVHDPREFVRQALPFLRDDGSLILASGNFLSPTFRLMGPSYWYTTIAEHISFVSPQWCESISVSTGLRIERLERYAHISSNLSRRFAEAVANLLYRASPRAFGALRKSGLGRKDVGSGGEFSLYPPNWMSARDHFIVEFRAATTEQTGDAAG